MTPTPNTIHIFLPGGDPQASRQGKITTRIVQFIEVFLGVIPLYFTLYGFPDAKSAPLVFVTAEAKLQQVIDLREGKNRQRLRIAESAILDTDWRKENRNGKEAITQAWGWALHESGVEGFIVPSSANRGGSSLIVFPGNLRGSSHLKVLSEIDWPR